MKLIDIKNYNNNLNVIQNNCFENLTFNYNDNLTNVLTFCSTITFLEKAIVKNNISAVITSEKVYEKLRKKNKFNEIIIDKGIVLSKNPREDFFKFHNYLAENTEFYKKENISFKGKNTKISKLASVSKNNVHIGNNVIIEDFVKIYDNVYIGDNSIIRSGCKIGGEGFQFPVINNKIYFIKHVGGVKIGNNVELQNNCTVDRSIFRGYTEIGDHTKIDNFVHVAHSSKIGNNCRIAAGAIILGSVYLGNKIWIGPGVIISDSLIIEDEVSISLGSVVVKNCKKGEELAGNFAINKNEFILKNIQALY
ncbi:MAG: hypothetical protein A2Y41_05925 [Spirochaetes bacterium GWB1_36_13]|nr:MAG: hypothetical protein A2Y41_05925 [Spirochaetes bacterium GWB1_36_13]